MKRNVFVTLFWLLVFALAACGGGGGGASDPGSHDQPPLAVTLAADNVGINSVTLHANINPNGLPTTFQWEYDTDVLFSNPLHTAERAAGSGIVSLPFEEFIGGLADNTTFYFRVRAWSGAGNAVNSGVFSFTTGSAAPNTPPTVTTLGATNISQTSATLNGQVNPNGTASDGRFRWGYSAGSLTNFTPWVAVGSGSTSVAINAVLTGLSTGTKVYYQAEGDSSAGSNTGVVANFTTAAPNTPPTVTTLGATSIGQTSATLNGQVNPNGTASNGRFRWGLNTGNLTNLTPLVSVGSGSTGVAITAVLTGLSPGTKVYYQAEGSSSAGSNLGVVANFTTAAPNTPPTVTTLSATNISQTGGTLNGQVNPNGTASDGRFRWGYSAGSLTNFTPWVAVGSGSTSVAINASLTGQNPGTKIYYQAEGDSSAGSNTGVVANFTTAAPNTPPTVTTLGANNISQTGATLNGQVNPNGTASNGRFRWGYSSGSLTNFTPWVAVGSGSTSVAINASLTGQNPGTKIYYQAEGSSAVGSNLGSVANFTTAPLTVSAPTVTTGGSSNISVNSATIAGSVNPNGADTVAFVLYSTNPDLSGAITTPSQSVGAGRSDVPVSFNLSELAANTTFYYRVGATNSEGADNSSAILSFTTLPVPTTTVTITGSIHQQDSLLIFRNNVQATRIDGYGSSYTNFSYTGESNVDYKFIWVGNNRFFSSVVDMDDNNVFRFPSGGILDFGAATTALVGRTAFGINGYGFTAGHQAPNINGVYTLHEVVDESTNANVPVGSSQDRVITLNRNEFEVYYTDPALGTIEGTANGDLVYLQNVNNSDPIWSISWTETWIVNSTGSAFTGDGTETWQARSGTAYYYVHWNTTAIR